jgi:hypothetical protein
VGPLLLPLVDHPDVGRYGGLLHPLAAQVARLLKQQASAFFKNILNS